MLRFVVRRLLLLVPILLGLSILVFGWIMPCRARRPKHCSVSTPRPSRS